MKIGIFGGTFNPIHKGHLLVAEFALNHLKLDKIIFVPTYINPFKVTKQKTSDLKSNANHRIKMLEIVTNPYHQFEISTFEIKRQGISYSIDTVKYFKQKYPQADLYYLIGSDKLKSLNKWEGIEVLAKLVKIAIFRRSENFMHLNFKKYDCLLLKNPLLNYSSSDYKKGNLKMVEPEVQMYIGAHKLYLWDLLQNWLDPVRFLHSLNTAKLAQTYAMKLRTNSEQSYWAGLLHDLTKNWTEQEHRNFLHKIHNSTEHFPPHELHGLTASLWLEKCYLINDQTLTNAIKVHTVLSEDLTTLDKIVYAADKLCEGRKWLGIQKLRSKILDNFEQGFEELVGLVYKKILEKHKNLTQKQIMIYEKWSK